MEKLLSLVNQYHPVTNPDTEYRFDEKSIWLKEYQYSGTAIWTKLDEIIISKRFGFIKWLVKEDKIDHGLFSNIMVESNLFDNIADLTEAEVLIMYLSIQDDPIIFLSSLLK